MYSEKNPMASSRKDSKKEDEKLHIQAESNSPKVVPESWDTTIDNYVQSLGNSVHVQVSEPAPGIKLTTIAPYEVVRNPVEPKPGRAEPVDVQCFIAEQIRKFDEAMEQAQSVRKEIEKIGIKWCTVNGMQDAVDTMVLCFQELEDIVDPELNASVI